MTLLQNLMNKQSVGHYFSKTDMADAYQQVK